MNSSDLQPYDRTHKHLQGLALKFFVRRKDGSSDPRQKHHDCAYFVLDLTPGHDPHAKAALLAYATSCQQEYPALAKDLRTAAEPM